ncbi:unnamed protein product [Cunninghamella blakesleeana]
MFKMNQTENMDKDNFNSKLKESHKVLVSSKEKEKDTIINLGLAFKDFVSTHMTEPLKNYSIVYAKESSDPIKELSESDIQKKNNELQDKKKQNVKEINIGEKTELVVDNAEWAIKKTHQLSKEMVNSWQNGNTPDKILQSVNYSNTFKILKDRATLIIDVAFGKYDKKENDTSKNSNNNNSNNSNNNNNDNDKPNDKDS